jgi:2-(1,2-epoxy-1,2-dihydrophenyl)acetyl-CoA isomerase
MPASRSIVLTRLQEGVLTLTLDHPKVNAINTTMLHSLSAAFDDAARDPQVCCVVLTGAGDTFSAGQDLSEAVQAGDLSYRDHLLQTYNPLVLQIRRLEKPVLAAINGAVSGAALGLALACDLRIAADTARLVVGFLGIGLVPDSGVSLFLPALVGLGRAGELAFLNEPLPASQALSWGLVNRVVPAADLPRETLAWAKELSKKPIQAIGLAKRAFNKAVLSNLEEVLDYEAHLQEIAHRGVEHQAALQAFHTKSR